MWCDLDKPAFGSMLEMTKPLSFALGTHVLKAFIVIFSHVTCEEQVPIVTTSNYKSQWCILSQCWKQLLSACTCPWNACHYKAGNQLSLFFFFFFSPALIKSDLRRHNVNSGIMNMDVKAVSGDSFTLWYYYTWMAGFYWINIGRKERLTKTSCVTVLVLLCKDGAVWDAAIR